MTPTARLLAAVEGGDKYIDRPIQDAFGRLNHSDRSQWADKAYYRNDLTAALSLVEAMLPKWTAIEIASRNAQSRWVAEVSRVVDDVEECMVGRADTAARALLIAALRALVAQEGV